MGDKNFEVSPPVLNIEQLDFNRRLVNLIVRIEELEVQSAGGFPRLANTTDNVNVFAHELFRQMIDLGISIQWLDPIFQVRAIDNDDDLVYFTSSPNALGGSSFFRIFFDLVKDARERGVLNNISLDL